MEITGLLSFLHWFFLKGRGSTQKTPNSVGVYSNPLYDYVFTLGGGFKYFVLSPLLGEMIHFDYIIFFRWVETTN